MQYKYDSYNRIQKMTYPDGEVVHYDYNRGGMLKKVYGTVTVGVTEPPLPSTPHVSLVPLNLHGLGGQASLNSLPPVGDPVPLYDTHTYSYIDSIAYNEFELKSEVFYGNGTHALYAYDSLLRLLLLQSQTRTGDIMQDIVYTYDSVGNITSISNGAGMLPNGLGGTYNSAYTYDDLYRLTSSTGGWQGSQNISYRTTTLYRGNGRIKQKNLAARKLLNGVSDSVNYSHYYHYENTSQPNTLTRYSSSVWNPGSWLGISNEEDSQFGWDAAGNMTESCIGGDRNCRSLCWDEQNRLQGVKDNKWLSYYQYDAAGDRTYKLTGKGELQNINGEWRYFYHLDNATLYVSPYLVATKQGYTKHYYAETERIASRIGGGRLRYLDQPVVVQGKIVEKQSTNKTYAKEVLEECLDAIHSEGQADLHHLYDMINSAHSETDCYWYHPDHLGSSSWITDSAGTAVQHLHYLPWGEDFVDQRSTTWNAMYTFSAKERDSETGLSYFGSRYYSSDLSVWLSVDPMSDKYPSTSPYAYCRNNPIVLYDPNGMFDDWVMDKYGVIYWDENAKDQSTTKFGEQYLGRAGQRSYGTAVVNYKSNGTWSFMNPVEISSNSSVGSDMATSVSNSTGSGVMKKVTGWVCGNGEWLNGASFCTTVGGGLVSEGAKSSERISKTANEVGIAKGMGKVAKAAKWLGYAGEAINIAVAFSNYTNDPTGGNFAKLVVTSATAFSNGLNVVVPGLGTAVSIGISIIDVNGGFDWLYNKFK